MKTQVPSSTNSFAVASAMPEVAAVMTATFPCSFPMTLSFLTLLLGVGATAAASHAARLGISEFLSGSPALTRGVASGPCAVLLKTL